MEQHPVPQNVTTFQFRLVGDMTIKQFGYLAGGAILAYIMYKLPLPFFFTWPLAVLSALGGFGLAFVPIEERPMDVWILSFIKSIYSPTQFVWSKREPEPKMPVSQPPFGAAQPQAQPFSQPGGNPPLAAPTKRDSVLNNIFLTPAAAPVVPKMDMFDRLFNFLTPKQTPARPQAPTPSSTPINTQWSQVSSRHMDFSPPPVVKPAATATPTLEDVQQRESEIEDKLKNVQAELKGKTEAEARVIELQAHLTELLAEREKMNLELEKLRLKSSAPIPADAASPPHYPPATISPPVVAHVPSASGQVTTTQTPAGQSPLGGARTPTIQIIAPGRAEKVGLPRLTTFPNIVTGIVKDKDKNLLPGVIVMVKDKEGVPLRALKTNRLGQFAASTQLTNGVYFIETEDPRKRFLFDRAQITLNGSIVPALEIFAKTEKEITRAKLEKELFGNPI